MMQGINLITNEADNTLQKRIEIIIEDFINDDKKPDFCIITGYFNAQALSDIAQYMDKLHSLKIILGERSPKSASNPEAVFYFRRDSDNSLEIEALEKQIDEITYQSKAAILLNNDFVEIRSRIEKPFIHSKLYIIKSQKSTDRHYTIIGSSNLTSSGFGMHASANKELNLLCDSQRDIEMAIKYFNEQWDNVQDCKDKVIEELNNGFFNHSASEIFAKIKSLHGDFNAIDDDKKANLDSAAKLFELYRFQKEAARQLIARLETCGVALLADPVGAGKTLVALAIAAVYKSSLIIAPPKLKEQWKSYFDKEETRYIHRRIHTYHEICKQDSEILNQGYGIIIIDESHNLRNTGKKYHQMSEAIKAIRKFNKPKLLLLSATPINNSYIDLANQLLLFDDKILIKGKEFAPKSICIQAKNDQANDRPLSNDFYGLCDSVIVCRDANAIKVALKAQKGQDIPKISIEKKVCSSIPKDFAFDFTNLYEKFGISLKDVKANAKYIKFVIYNPYKFLPTEISQSLESDEKTMNLGAYATPTGFIHMTLLKALESSVDAFLAILDKIIKYHRDFDSIIESDDEIATEILPYRLRNIIDKGYLDELDNSDFRTEIESDLEILEEIKNNFSNYNSDRDFAKSEKFIELSAFIKDNDIKKEKLLIFSESIITTQCITQALEREFSHLVIKNINGDTKEKQFGDFKRRFAPKSSKYTLKENEKEIDILVASDVLSEGQNLQDCGNLINWDIAFNPVRAMQRIGRINRINSPHKENKVLHFFPKELEDYIQLEIKLIAKIESQEHTLGTRQNIFGESEKALRKRYEFLENDEIDALVNETSRSYLRSLYSEIGELEVEPNSEFKNGIFSIANLDNIKSNTIVAFLQEVKQDKLYCIKFDMNDNHLSPSATNEDTLSNFKAILPLQNSKEILHAKFSTLENITNQYRDIRVLQVAFAQIQKELASQIRKRDTIKVGQDSMRGAPMPLLNDDDYKFNLIAWLLINPNFEELVWKR